MCRGYPWHVAYFCVPSASFVAFEEGVDFEVDEAAADEHAYYVEIYVAVEGGEEGVLC